jgi:type IV pilus assembly protein PilE
MQQRIGFLLGVSAMGRGRSAGFTLIELMIVVIVLGILTAIALPAYQDSVLKGNRAVAKAKLLEVASRQEAYFADNKTYQDSLAFLGFPTATMGVDNNSNWVAPGSTDAVYVISVDADVVSDSDGIRYLLTADTAGRQTQDDARCATLTLTDTGQRAATPSDGLGGGCWE